MNQRKPAATAKTDTVSARSASELPSDELQARRVDAAHSAANGAAEPASESDVVKSAPPSQELVQETMLAELATSEPNYSPEQLRHQTLQLATLLSERQRQLDRRETELNAQTAKLEMELRAAQMWSRERQFELQQRESKVQQREEELTQRDRGIDIARTSLGRELQARQVELEEWDTRLKQREREISAADAALIRRQGEFELAREVRQAQGLAQNRDLAAQRQRLEHRRLQVSRMFAEMSRQLERQRAGIEELCARRESEWQARTAAGSNEVAQALADLAERRRALEEQAAQLDHQLAELQQQRAALLDARQKHDIEAARREDAFAEERRKWLTNRSDAETQLKRRRESLDQRAKSLQSLHEEVNARNRESLELRLGAEQIWSQLAGKAAPAELTRRLGQFRARLAEQQREDQEIAHRQRTEILALAADLEQKQASLRQQQRELQRWLATRNDDLEQQAARLVAREQELDRQEAEFAHDRETWAVQRASLQQQIRRLQTQLGDASSKTVAAL